MQGYAAVGFPVTPGKMVPADGVIGSIDGATGAVQVSYATAAHSCAHATDRLADFMQANRTVRRNTLALSSLTMQAGSTDSQAMFAG